MCAAILAGRKYRFMDLFAHNSGTYCTTLGRVVLLSFHNIHTCMHAYIHMYIYTDMYVLYCRLLDRTRPCGPCVKKQLSPCSACCPNNITTCLSQWKREELATNASVSECPVPFTGEAAQTQPSNQQLKVSKVSLHSPSFIGALVFCYMRSAE